MAEDMMSPLRRIEHDPGPDDLRMLIRKTLNAEVTSARSIGEGAYGITYDVLLSRDPGRAVVKWQKRPGRGILEKRQLEELRKHAEVTVPAVFGYHSESEELPFEAVVMEYIPGVPASTLPTPDEPVRKRFAHQVVEILLQWHSVCNAEGFGSLDGPYHPRWIDFFGLRLEAHLEHVRADARNDNILPLSVRGMAERSFALTEAIIGQIKGQAVLIHSDFWLPNVMVNPANYSITGVIDPLDAEWAHRELDLINLESYLLQLYEQRRPLSEGYPFRLAFYEFWYAMQNFARFGWHEEEETIRLAKELEAAIGEYM